MIKRPETIATEMSGVYVKNESISFSYCMDMIYHFLYVKCNWQMDEVIFPTRIVKAVNSFSFLSSSLRDSIHSLSETIL
jgi:hypothetical protein